MSDRPSQVSGVPETPAPLRIEMDLLGPVEVPAAALYGAQTQRALANFPTGRQRTIGSFPSLISALLWIKKAAALVNEAIGALDPRRAGAIVAAAERLLAEPCPGAFPVHFLSGGGGTSANINADEVLANLSEEILGGRRGEYRKIHPNDHVNLHQSTNDVYPTACRMAVITEGARIEAALGDLDSSLKDAGERFRHVPHLTRTCLQDAVPATWQDFFRGQAGFVARVQGRLTAAVDALHTVILGGSIVGRSDDVPVAYLQRIVPQLRAVTGDPAYRQAGDLFDAAQNADDLAAVSGQLDLLARGLIKIAKDLRLLSSGPEAGLGELRLPAVQPGSTCMPGKVNPVMPEFLIQTAFRVIGNHAACISGLDHGELDLNVWESSMAFPILESLELMTDAIRAFADRCVAGLEVDEERSTAHAATLIPLLTAQSKAIGYARVTAICRQAGGDPAEIRRLLKDTSAQGPSQP